LSRVKLQPTMTLLAEDARIRRPDRHSARKILSAGKILLQLGYEPTKAAGGTLDGG
jgi:hypothetical protein